MPTLSWRTHFLVSSAALPGSTPAGLGGVDGAVVCGHDVAVDVDQLVPGVGLGVQMRFGSSSMMYTRRLDKICPEVAGSEESNAFARRIS